MGLGNAFGRVYRLQALNLLRLCKWLFWAAVFFVVGLLTGAHWFGPSDVRYEKWGFFAALGFAVVGFLLRLWEWRLGRPVESKK